MEDPKSHDTTILQCKQAATKRRWRTPRIEEYPPWLGSLERGAEMNEPTPHICSFDLPSFVWLLRWYLSRLVWNLDMKVEGKRATGSIRGDSCVPFGVYRARNS